MGVTLVAPPADVIEGLTLSERNFGRFAAVGGTWS